MSNVKIENKKPLNTMLWLAWLLEDCGLVGRKKKPGCESSPYHFNNVTKEGIELRKNTTGLTYDNIIIIRTSEKCYRLMRCWNESYVGRANFCYETFRTCGEVLTFLSIITGRKI